MHVLLNDSSRVEKISSGLMEFTLTGVEGDGRIKIENNVTEDTRLCCFDYM